MPRYVITSLAILAAATAWAGPYAGPVADPDNPFDAGIPGWVGPAGDGVAHVDPWYPHPGQVLNPAFVGWAAEVTDYAPAPVVDAEWTDPSYALGAATGDEFEVVSLGDMTAAQIAAYLADPTNPAAAHPGSITLRFAEPIYNGHGPDLAVFENGFSRTGAAEFFAELAYVEVSTDGATFARFAGRSLSAQPPKDPDQDDWSFATIDVTGVYNLAGKHANAHGVCWGTPFDLAQLAGDPAVAAGVLDLNDIRYVRIVDIPGSGDFLDAAEDAIYDGWLTVGSGGFDLDAVGALYAGAVAGDATGDGRVDLSDFVVLKQNFGARGVTHADGDFTGDAKVDLADFVVLKLNFGAAVVTTSSRQIVPEPTTLALILLGGTVSARRRFGRSR